MQEIIIAEETIFQYLGIANLNLSYGCDAAWNKMQTTINIKINKVYQQPLIWFKPQTSADNSNGVHDNLVAVENQAFNKSTYH